MTWSCRYSVCISEVYEYITSSRGFSVDKETLKSIWVCMRNCFRDCRMLFSLNKILESYLLQQCHLLHSFFHERWEILSVVLVYLEHWQSVWVSMVLILWKKIPPMNCDEYVQREYLMITYCSMFSYFNWLKRIIYFIQLLYLLFHLYLDQRSLDFCSLAVFHSSVVQCIIMLFGMMLDFVVWHHMVECYFWLDGYR